MAETSRKRKHPLLATTPLHSSSAVQKHSRTSSNNDDDAIIDNNDSSHSKGNNDDGDGSGGDINRSTAKHHPFVAEERDSEAAYELDKGVSHYQIARANMRISDFIKNCRVGKEAPSIPRKQLGRPRLKRTPSVEEVSSLSAEAEQVTAADADADAEAGNGDTSANNAEVRTEQSQATTDEDRQNSESDGKDSSGGAQIKFIDGKIVIIEKTIEVGVQEHNLAAAKAAFRTEESYTTSSSFKKHDKAQVWSLEETRMFYTALQQTGTNFSMLSILFPKRSRNQIKRKFRQEERRNPVLIEAALNVRQPIDLDLFTRSGNAKEAQIESPTPVVASFAKS